LKSSSPNTQDLRAAIEAAGDRLTPFAARLITYDVIGSTNDEAVRLAAHGSPEGTVVIADTQTAGRGRNGRTWHSPPGSGLYVSVVCRPTSSGSEESAASASARLITLAAGVGVAEGIRAATALPVEIKWPNDIVTAEGRGPRVADRRWRKVAGILAEASATADGIQHVVIGFGINVGASAFPHDLASNATSLETEAGRRLDRGAVLVETLAAFWKRYRDLECGRERLVLARWRELSPSAYGARVAVLRDAERMEGTTDGVDDRGALCVRTASAVETVVAGEVSWI
jgi:BirA family transcriptional regulator, biotin operon repressor / biotin---[acetyl-CoA-carboxylase] ligase